jgi:hypothetical protein
LRCIGDHPPVSAASADRSIYPRGETELQIGGTWGQ